MPTGYKTYTVKQGQSVYDVCLNTYGTLDLLLKLMRDNGVIDVEANPAPGATFQYDPKLVASQSLQNRNFVFATANEFAIGQLPGAYITENSAYDTTATFYISSDSSNTFYVP